MDFSVRDVIVTSHQTILIIRVITLTQELQHPVGQMFVTSLTIKKSSVRSVAAVSLKYLGCSIRPWVVNGDSFKSIPIGPVVPVILPLPRLCVIGCVCQVTCDVSDLWLAVEPQPSALFFLRPRSSKRILHCTLLQAVPEGLTGSRTLDTLAPAPLPGPLEALFSATPPTATALYLVAPSTLLAPPRVAPDGALVTAIRMSGRGGVVVRLLASHLREPGSISQRDPSRVFRMWESCRTMQLVGRFWLGSPVSPRPLIPALLHTRIASLSSALNTPKLRAAQVSSLTHDQAETSRTCLSFTCVNFGRKLFGGVCKACVGGLQPTNALQATHFAVNLRGLVDRGGSVPPTKRGHRGLVSGDTRRDKQTDGSIDWPRVCCSHALPLPAGQSVGQSGRSPRETPSRTVEC
ncbi:hypothetical protein PR048_028950 [Dryococelus australis]|uniref:Uncharacterized protein n=1 Tax=Dryococelus australis TaxID=614101 RepID=A0ABQ9GFN0_9NEOP|nr:hypothetical protein PR048_028950 [Dryococelus australis]